MGKRSDIAQTMRTAAELLQQYSVLVRMRVDALVESKRKKLEFEEKVKVRRGK